jgi:hypothetical protein
MICSVSERRDGTIDNNRTIIIPHFSAIENHSKVDLTYLMLNFQFLIYTIPNIKQGYNNAIYNILYKTIAI